jgi:hypothetical protein
VSHFLLPRRIKWPSFDSFLNQKGVGIISPTPSQSYRLIGLYRTHFGFAPSSPKRFLLFASYFLIVTVEEHPFGIAFAGEDVTNRGLFLIIFLFEWERQADAPSPVFMVVVDEAFAISVEVLKVEIGVVCSDR